MEDYHRWLLEQFDILKTDLMIFIPLIYQHSICSSTGETSLGVMGVSYFLLGHLVSIKTMLGFAYRKPQTFRLVNK